MKKFYAFFLGVLSLGLVSSYALAQVAVVETTVDQTAPLLFDYSKYTDLRQERQNRRLVASSTNEVVDYSFVETPIGDFKVRKYVFPVEHPNCIRILDDYSLVCGSFKITE